MSTGRLTTPFGTPYIGFKVTIGGVSDPAMTERTYEDIDKIFKSNPGDYHVKEERDANGKFQSFHVSTEPIN